LHLGLLALLSGVFLALSFPKHGHPAFGWIALTPLVICAWRATSRRQAFFFGLLAGAVYFWGTLYWLIETMTTFGGLSTLTAVFAAFLLVAYLSLFPAAFAVIVQVSRRGLGAGALALVAPAWVTTELGRQYVWDGFPWALLGYSQVTVLPVAQIASVVGVYGLSGLLAFTAAALAAPLLLAGRQRLAFPAVAVVAVAGCTVWGYARLDRSALLATGDPVRVAVIQGNIAQEDKWDPALRDAITDRYLSMTRAALADGATFIIWPESSTPFYFEQDLIRGAAIRRLATEAGATLLIGSDQVEPVQASPAVKRGESRYYNAAFLIRPDGQIGGVYRKMHLVPFGEYVPLQKLLFFVGPIVEAVSAFTPGEEPALLPVGEHVASTAICYEVIFPSLIRRFVADGSELLTTITNDAWYGRSSAAYQHWEQASMRAIEQGRYLARAANTGISGFVDPYGRVVEKTDLFHEAVVAGDLRFIRERTIYSRTGDLVAWLSLAVTLAAVAAALRMRRHTGGYNLLV
jgi:apolipoprotein N-acyltransferase